MVLSRRTTSVCHPGAQHATWKSCGTRGWQDRLVRQEIVGELSVVWCREAMGTAALWEVDDNAGKPVSQTAWKRMAVLGGLDEPEPLRFGR